VTKRIERQYQCMWDHCKTLMYFEGTYCSKHRNASFRYSERYRRSKSFQSTCLQAVTGHCDGPVVRALCEWHRAQGLMVIRGEPDWAR